jgi:hypothetical protein
VSVYALLPAHQRRAIAALTHRLPDGPLPAALAGRARDDLLRLTIHTLVVLLFGIISLMTLKPSLVDELAVMTVSALGGLVPGVLFLLARQMPTTNAMEKHHEKRRTRSRAARSTGRA